MTELLANSVAVVTGAASGNGRGIARELARHGADVVVADVRETPREGGAPTHELITDETRSEAAFVQCDVTDLDDIDRAIDRAEEFGPLTTMVNNAGIIPDEELLETTKAEFEQVIGVNLAGVFFGSQLAAKRMVQRQEGSIINISGTAGLVGSANSPTYSASKGGVRLATYSMARYLGPEGIRVNAVHPGTVETEMMREDLREGSGEPTQAELDRIPLGRTAEPVDVANAVVYLASDLASHVTAESLVVDGGMTYTSG